MSLFLYFIRIFVKEGSSLCYMSVNLKLYLL